VGQHGSAGVRCWHGQREQALLPWLSETSSAGELPWPCGPTREQSSSTVAQGGHNGRGQVLPTRRCRTGARRHDRLASATAVETDGFFPTVFSRFLGALGGVKTSFLR